MGQEREKRESDRDVQLAWTMVALGRTQKLPSLSTLLSRGRKQTPKAQKTMLEMISARTGIPLRKVRLIRKETRG